MEWSKLKNIILAILVVTNLFLLFLVFGQGFQSAQFRDGVLTDAVTLLSESGITLDPDILPKTLPTAQSVVRDADGELAAAQSLLGADVTAEVESAVLTRYSGTNGVAQFRNSGDFDVNFTTTAFPLDGKTPGTVAAKTAELLGGTWSVFSVSGNATDATVTLRQMYQQVPVFSCTVQAVYRGGFLASLSGRHLSGIPTPSTAETLDLPTLLVRFRAGITQTGDVCSAITEITPGYALPATLTGNNDLTPILEIVTDTKTYHQNLQTGAISPA
ncbi:MAG: hypothetical protein RSC89_05840 [Oscillospiraceae bacterium]